MKKERGRIFRPRFSVLKKVVVRDGCVPFRNPESTAAANGRVKTRPYEGLVHRRTLVGSGLDLTETQNPHPYQTERHIGRSLQGKL
ncbi:MAG: hypothetical protein ACI3W5_11910 [Faecousia sp.]